MCEKLIELVDDILGYLPWGEVSPNTAKEVADHLIANGVTIQRWIPMTEQLPEYGQTVVVRVHFPFDGDARMAVTTYDQNYNPHFWKRVTHWMPLPEPPKEPTS